MTASDNLPKVSTSGVVSRRFSTTELEPAAEAQGLVASAKFVVERSSVPVFKIPRSVLASTMVMVVFLCVVFSQAPDSSIVPAPVRVLAPRSSAGVCSTTRRCCHPWCSTGYLPLLWRR